MASEYLDTCHMISKYPIHAYEESVTYGTHFEAEKFCSDVGAELVVIRDEAENQAIVDMASKLLSLSRRPEAALDAPTFQTVS